MLVANAKNGGKYTSQVVKVPSQVSKIPQIANVLSWISIAVVKQPIQKTLEEVHTFRPFDFHTTW